MKEPGEDGRLPCSLDVRPTDEEAVAAGFKDAVEWYSYSTSGHLKDPAIAKYNLGKLPLPVDDESEPELAGEVYQGWRTDPEADAELDLTSVVHEDLRILHPYLLTDVEQLNYLGDKEPLVLYVYLVFDL